MCMGCMANGDFLLTSGILGAASVRVGLRRYLPGRPSWRRKPTRDGSTAAVVAPPDPTSCDLADLTSQAAPHHDTDASVSAGHDAPSAGSMDVKPLIPAAPGQSDHDPDGGLPRSPAHGTHDRVLAAR